MQKKPNTRLRDLLKSKKPKIPRVSELFKIETSKLAKANECGIRNFNSL